MIVVAIDGPAGVGKSSISKAVAKKYGFAYLDTGAMYRAVAWWCLKNGVNLSDTDAVSQAALDFCESHLRMAVNPRKPQVFCDKEDITSAIREADVSSNVSAVSSFSSVRSILINAQKQIISDQKSDDSYSNGRGIVVEGRDITTVVAPKAQVRVLLTAREEVRKKRREKQAQHLRTGADDIAARDHADSKVTQFLMPAKGVTTVDNSDMSFAQTLAAFERIVDVAIQRQQEAEEQQRHTPSSLSIPVAVGADGVDDTLGTVDDFKGDYRLTDEDRKLLDSDLLNGSDEPKPVGVLAVVGRPNVGKSTLVNRILGRKAAVVENRPGVTRDRVSYEAEWCGNDFLLVDTGGWEADTKGIDSAVAEQVQVAIQLSDAILFVVDVHTGMTSTDERLVRVLRKSGKPVVVAVNKIDTQREEAEVAEFWRLGLGEPQMISAMHGRGVGDLLDACVAMLKKSNKTSGLMRSSKLRKVALIGRPNVGKSSLLNQLAHADRSIVNDVAGTTRDPVDEVINLGGRKLLLIDTAGIRKKLQRVSGADYYSTLRSQAAIERSELCLVLFDVSQPIAEQDLRVMTQAVNAGKAIVLVFNKWDLLNEYSRARLERIYQSEFSQVTWAERVNLSAKTGWHTNRLPHAIETALESWDQRISTSKLNTFFGKIQAAHPHPLRGGKQPRILFATQASTRPPRFVIFTTGFFDHSYTRYIEHQLREEFGFTGTPIQLSLRVREKRRKNQ